MDEINHGSKAELEEFGPGLVWCKAQRVQCLRGEAQFLQDMGIPRNSGRRAIRAANNELRHFRDVLPEKQSQRDL